MDSVTAPMGFRRAIAAVRTLLAQMLAASPRATVLSVLLLLAMTFMEGIGLLLLLPLLELVGVVEESPLPRAQHGLTTLFQFAGLTPTLAGVLSFFVSVVMARSLLQRWQFRLNAVVREDLIAARRSRLYRAISDANWPFLAARRSSDLVQILSAEVTQLGAAATHLIDVAVAAAAASVYLALAIRVSPSTAAIVLGGAMLLAWMMRGSLKRAARSGALLSDARRSLHRALTEHVAGFKAARTFGAVGRQEAAFAEISRVTRTRQLRLAAEHVDLQQDLEVGSTLVLAAIVFVSATFVRQSPAILLLMLYTFARLMPRLVGIYRNVQGLLGLLPSVQAVATLEAECLAAADTAVSPGVPVPPLTEAILFEAVSYTYRDRPEPALRDVTMSIPAGLTTAIVGASGAGKSTIADLTLGLLSPASGRILIDGQPLTPDRVGSWREQVAYVTQETFLFQTTIRQNLLWAEPAASDDDLWAALRMSAAERFVRALPEGLDTMIGERGLTLSGGERQRLAIARALLRRPRVLVLDEATSALDPENEAQIQLAVDALRHRMTILLIAHRWSTVKHADLVHVLDSGRVIESAPAQVFAADRQERRPRWRHES